jgi:hypothetical protein
MSEKTITIKKSGKTVQGLILLQARILSSLSPVRLVIAIRIELPHKNLKSLPTAPELCPS